MNKLDRDYQALLQDILDNGYKKSDRTGTGTISVFGRQIRHQMSDGFPILTTKKIPFRLVVTELLWFLRGDTNIKYLVDNDCHIWDGDCYKAYLKEYEKDNSIGLSLLVARTDGKTSYRKPTKEQFIGMIQADDEFAKKFGDLGPIYGKQWRSWNKWENTFGKGYSQSIDQIKNVINLLKTDPDSRRMLVSAWNVSEVDTSVLPPCHNFFQFYTRVLTFSERLNYYDPQKLYHNEVDSWFLDEVNIPTRAISLMFNMRSTDIPLGLPFNIASYGLLLEIISKTVNMVPEELIGNLGDAHIYKNQVEGCLEQIGQPVFEESPTLYPNGPMNEGIKKQIIVGHTREPYPLPKLDIHPGMLDYDLDKLEIDMFKILDYQSHPTIKFPLSN